MRRFLFLVLWTLAAGPVSFAQVEISRAEADFYFKDAEERVRILGQYLELIGGAYSDIESRRIYSRRVMEEVVLNEEVRFFNDLDPTGKSPKTLAIQDYLVNIPIFFRGEEGVDIRFTEVEVVPHIFYNTELDRLFIKVEVERSLEGTYYVGQTPRPVDDSRRLDFYLELVEQTAGLRVYGMAAHQDNTRGFERVKVLATEERLLLSDSRRKELEQEAEEARAQVQWFKEQLERLQRELEISRKQEELARREREVAKREAEQARRIAAQAQAAEEEARQDAQSEQTVREMTQLELIREKQRRREEAKRANQANQSRRTAENEAQQARRQARQMQRVAEKNRIHLQVGGGASVFTGPAYQGNANVESWGLSSFSGQAVLGYRLGSYRKGLPTQKTTINIFAQTGLMSDFALQGIFATNDAPLDLAGSQSGWFYEVETGLTFKQRIRLSGGVGWSDLSYYASGHTIVLREPMIYYLATVGFNQPVLNGAVQTGINGTAIFRDWETALSGQTPYIHPRLEAYMRFQIE
ncbi:MAG: hypothetical protein D6722_13230 [Bacteroidetes bacterium]|nr:MAG: hypothetical protein D6722_13230 [Bacteroidota bacterium]